MRISTKAHRVFYVYNTKTFGVLCHLNLNGCFDPRPGVLRKAAIV